MEVVIWQVHLIALSFSFFIFYGTFKQPILKFNKTPGKMKKILFLIPVVLLLTGCSSDEEDMIFHYSVLKALDNGVLEGSMKVRELKQHGDLGLGTYNKLNGEMPYPGL